MGYWLHHGWTDRWRTIVPWRVWSWPAVRNPESSWGFDVVLIRAVCTEPKIYRLQVSRRYEAIDDWEKVRRQSFTRRPGPDERAPNHGSKRQTHSQASVNASLLRRSAHKCWGRTSCQRTWACLEESREQPKQQERHNFQKWRTVSFKVWLEKQQDRLKGQQRLEEICWPLAGHEQQKQVSG